MLLANTSLISDANLQAYYKLENANDSGPNARNLTSNGSPTFTAGIFGNGANLGVDGGWLSQASNQGITSGNYSIVGWNKCADSTSFSLFGYSSAAVFVFSRIAYVGAGSFSFYRVKSGVAQQGPLISYTPVQGVWTHYAAVYDGVNVTGYINGAQVGQGAASGNGTSGTGTGSFIGSDTQSPVSADSSGVYDDVAFFNRVLTPAEIATLAGRGGGFFSFFQ